MVLSSSDPKQAVFHSAVCWLTRLASPPSPPPWDELDPDAVYVIDPGSFVAGTYRGHDGIRTLVRLTAEIIDEFRYELDEVVDRAGYWAGVTLVGLITPQRVPSLTAALRAAQVFVGPAPAGCAGDVEGSQIARISSPGT